jgi:hypothetical protein
MIVWWVWLIVWVVLGLGLLALLGLSAWWLFRKFLVLTGDLADLAETLVVLEPDDAGIARPELAVLADVRDIRAREEARRFHRSTRKRERHDSRIARARRITAVDAAMQQWPSDWTAH